MLYCILLPVLSCPQMLVGRSPPCSHAQVPNTTTHGFQPNIQTMTPFPSELWVRGVSRAVDRPECCKHFSFSFHPMGGKLEWVPLPHHVISCWRRGRARLSKNTSKFPAILSVAFLFWVFSWLLQALDPFPEHSVVYLMFPGGEQGLGASCSYILLTSFEK